MFLFFVLYHFMLSVNFCYGSEIRHEIFLGNNFGPGTFLGSDFCSHSITPVTWNPEYPSGLEFSCIRTLNFSHFPSQVNLYFSDWKLCGGEQWKNYTFLKPSNASKIVGENNTAEILALTGIFVGFNSGPKVPFPGVLHIGQFHFPQMKPYKLVEYFIKVSFHIVVDMRQGESNIFQISTWKAFLSLKIYLLWKIRPISVKGWKPVWIRICPIVLLVNPN